MDNNLGEKTLFQNILYPKEIISRRELMANNQNDKR